MEEKKMSEERTFKNIGDEIAVIAVEDGLANTQLRTLYNSARSEPTPTFEAHLQYKISKVPEMRRVGEKLLQILQDYQENKQTVVKILQYTLLVFEYTKMKPVMGLESKIKEETNLEFD